MRRQLPPQGQTMVANWIPAHPCYGSISMLRYWRSLAEAWETGDAWDCTSVLGAPPGGHPRFGSKVERALARRVGYPARIRIGTTGHVAHVLDHSWADLLRWVPKQVPKVVTVHDLIPLRFRGELGGAQQARFASWVSNVERADAVVTVSRHTKGEVIDLLGIPEERITVVPNGVDHAPEPTDCPELRSHIGLNVEDLVIGSLGSVLQRKNLSVLPPALKSLGQAEGRRVVLLRAGQKLPESLEAELRSVLGEEGLVELGQVDDAGLEGFYAALDLLLVPSLYEGFGLPLLEAMARGVPVISSNATSLPEVGADAALYFDPGDPEELAERIREVIQPNTAEILRDNGRLRAGGFSWRKTLEGVYSVYDRLV